MNRLKMIAERREQILGENPHWVKEIAAIRKDSIGNLSQLLSQSQETLKSKGCNVYIAVDKKDAQKTVRGLFVGQNQVVRTYSSALREIAFDHLLSHMGITVHKSLLAEIIGDYLDDASTGHPFLPHFDLDKDTVIKALQEFLQSKDVASPEEWNRAAQQKIKDSILPCEFGVTGVNGISAENGTIIVTEDEGNCRAVSNLPYKHLAVAGIEKIVSTVEESLKIQECQSIFGLGRRTPTYYSLISGPSRTGDIEFRITYGMHGPKEVHVILLDNGRKNLVDQGFGELLKCIDCGACYESMADLAARNGWTGIPLTPKGIALGIAQGVLPQPTSEQSMAEFDCPVEINSPGLGPILPQIESMD
ncbi:LUD domain-containing protein [Acidobacteriota bacterium]